MKPGSAAAGFTYVGLLLAIASAAGIVSGGAYLLANDLRRDKELDLLLAGDEIRRAIEAYHGLNGSGVNPYPKSLDALLRDPHQPAVVRHLRRIRRDPMMEAGAEAPPAETGGWVLVRDAHGQVIGVHSSSGRAPLKRGGFPRHYEAFSQAVGYSDWKFIAAGALQAGASVLSAAGGNFIPSPLPPSVPLVPAGRGVPAAAPAQAPAAPAGAAAGRAPESPAIPVPPTANAAVAAPAAPPPPPSAPAPELVPAPAPAPRVSAAGQAPATPSTPAVPGAASAAPGAAPQGAAPAASQAPPPAPVVPPSLQGDGPQTFQIRTF